MDKKTVALIGHHSEDPSTGGIPGVINQLILSDDIREKFDFVSCSYDRNDELDKFVSYRLSAPLMARSIFKPVNALWFSYLLRKKVKILHLHGLNSTLFLPIISRWHKKIVCTPHSRDYLYPKWGVIAKIILRVSEAMMLRYATCVVAISKDQYDYYNNKARNRVCLIYNGIKTTELQKKTAHGWDASISLVGRITPEKGFNAFLQWFAKTDLNLRINIYGAALNDSYAKDFLSLVQKDPRVTFHGPTPKDVVIKNLQTSVFVSVSEFEGLSLASIEGAIYAYNVFLSDIDGNRALDLSNAQYFKSFEELAVSIATGIKFSDVQRKKVIERFDINQKLSQLRYLYEEL